MPPQPVQRYLVEKTASLFTVWRFNHKCQSLESGKSLRIESLAPTVVHWSADGWLTFRDCEARNTGLGIYTADLETAGFSIGTRIDFTFYWLQASRWEGADFSVRVTGKDICLK